MKSTHITINDIAREAGVSKSTVSKILNHQGSISEETVTRVNEIIERLGYIPNQRAVNFARGTSRNIVYIASAHKHTTYTNIFTFDIMCGASHELSRHGYSIALVDLFETLKAGGTVSDIVKSHSADGLLVHASALSDELIQVLRSVSLPHLIIGRPDLDPDLNSIDTDNTLAGVCAAEHMMECGYHSVLYVGPQKEELVSSQRLRGFKQYMLDHGHHVHRSHIVYTDGTRTGAYKTFSEFVKDREQEQPLADIDAIVCENNLLGLSVMRVLDEYGISTPEDIGFLTFDIHPYATIMDPLPTIVDVNAYDMGVAAADRILSCIDDPSRRVREITTFPVLLQGYTTIGANPPLEPFPELIP